jgi:hypothetical protein
MGLMGHGYPGKQSQMLIRRIYAKGKTTIRELLDICIRDEISFDAGEGPYYDEGMLSWAFELCIDHHQKNGVIEPDLSDELNRNIIEQWQSKDDTPEDFYEMLWEIPFKFAKGGRRKYLDKKINHLNYVEN